MKRRLTAAALVLIFPLSMAACGSQSTADACQELAGYRRKRGALDGVSWV